jgi:formylglycine-generating enzyme required for sulfatase activity
MANPANSEIRQFILDTFSDEDFTVLCADYFRDGQAEFAAGMSLRVKALRLVEYCHNRGLIDILLDALQRERPGPYAERFGARPARSPETSRVFTRDPRLDVFPDHPQEDAGLAPRRVAEHPPSSAVNPAPSQIRSVPGSDLMVIEEPFHMELVRVPAGEFLMGSDSAQDRHARPDEQPQHRVYVSEFYIGRYPVTNAQFATFAQASGHVTSAEKTGTGYTWTGGDWKHVRGADWRHPRGPGSTSDGRQNHPVVLVSWEDANAFCVWLGVTSRRLVGLPGEAEWEKAARGTADRIYPWGDAWDAGRLNSLEGGFKDTTPVGAYSPAGDSAYGIADMSGSVREWCADWYDENLYKGRSQQVARDPQVPPTGTSRVLRGGSWNYSRDLVRCASRDSGLPDDRCSDMGFRVVVR